MRRSLRTILIVACAALLGASLGALTAPSAEEGEKLFRQQCAACHTVGEGDRAGPDLLGVTEKRERGWLLRFLLETDKVHAEKDPIAMELLEKYKMPMPNLGLTRDQAESLIAYLESLSTKAPEQPTAQVPALVGGDPAVGKALFTGERPFQNGGASCLACHSAAGLTTPGGRLGPDLTPIYKRYGEDGLASVLETLPFPSMKPIYENRPLTPEERAHLLAFFREIADEQPAGASGTPVLFGGLGALVLLGLAQLLWRRRLTEVHQALAKGGKA